MKVMLLFFNGETFKFYEKIIDLTQVSSYGITPYVLFKVEQNVFFP
jgi:hypothetical protein